MARELVVKRISSEKRKRMKRRERERMKKREGELLVAQVRRRLGAASQTIAYAHDSGHGA